MIHETILPSDTPARDEPVPSRYALPVGDIEVLIISDGILPIPANVLAHNVEPGVLEAWLDEQFLPRETAEWPLNVMVVRSGEQVILIDAGLGMDPDLALSKAGRLTQRLEAAGIELGSITDVVLTHMHMDHIGGLVVGDTHERMRPDLRVHVAAKELPSGKIPTSRAPRCRRASPMRCAPRRRSSWRSTATGCRPFRKATSSRRVSPPSAPAGIRRAIASCASPRAASG